MPQPEEVSFFYNHRCEPCRARFKEHRFFRYAEDPIAVYGFTFEFKGKTYTTSFYTINREWFLWSQDGTRVCALDYLPDLTPQNIQAKIATILTFS